jgi:hypothetical protein
MRTRCYPAKTIKQRSFKGRKLQLQEKVAAPPAPALAPQYCVDLHYFYLNSKSCVDPNMFIEGPDMSFK